jgi:uncharacterized RDD family membrane protein YckC
MVIYAIFFFLVAILKYYQTNNPDVFFFHELVTLELNAIYIATFASLAMFYFIAIENKTNLERLAMFSLMLFVFLLSSRSIFFIDLILIVCYYLFFSKTNCSSPYGIAFGIISTF